MPPYTSGAALALVLLAGLLWASRREDHRLVLSFKAPLSALFVLAALLQPHPDTAYFYLVLAGLVLGLVGDVLLALPGQASFRAGLFAFLLGHLAYLPAFAGLAGAGHWLHPWLLAFPLASLAVFLWLRPRLGGMLVPVALYILVITAMTLAAGAAFSALAPPANWCILAGATAFYLSDLLVARQRFASPGFINRLLGLPLYYGGQFLIAFSVGMVGG